MTALDSFGKPPKEIAIGIDRKILKSACFVSAEPINARVLVIPNGRDALPLPHEKHLVGQRATRGGYEVTNTIYVFEVGGSDAEFFIEFAA